MPFADPAAKRAHHREYMRRRYQSDDLHRFKQKVRVATRKKLDAPRACGRCGGPNPQAHHPDYHLPLVVEWLCRDCHRAEHPAVC